MASKYREDQKTRDKNEAIEQDGLKMHFVVIDPVKADKKKLSISLYQYRFGKHELLDNKELEL